MSVRSKSLGLVLALALEASAHVAAARPDEQVAPSSVDAASRERSRAAFRKGVTQLRAQDWTGARASFEEAWSLVQHPSILLNLGIARLRTDDPVLAEQDLVRFLSEDPGAAPEELASAREALAEARSKIGTLRIVTTPASARVAIDGKPVGVRVAGGGGVAEARLKSGAHALSVQADGFRAEERSVDLPAKSDTELRVVLAASDAGQLRESGPSTRTIVGWSLAGTAGVALVASGVMALRAMSLANDYEERGSASFQDKDVKDEGIAFRTGADVALVAGLVAGAGAVVLLLTDIGLDRGAAVARVRARPVPAALLRW
ncbi:MAG: hypothetical protein K0S65_4179 [Labilithrix sp.]|nr:hypothetical protein [Labilithrix sp.]